MPNRHNVDAEGYRYAYQGQEKDPETGKEAFELRLWDSRIGRWLTTDPAGEFHSPYIGMGNNPVNGIDPDGGSTDDWILGDDGTYRWDKNITNHKQAKVAGVEYIGTSYKDVYADYNKRHNSFYKRVWDISIDYDSYNQAIFAPQLYDLAIAEKTQYGNPIEGFAFDGEFPPTMHTISWSNKLINDKGEVIPYKARLHNFTNKELNKINVLTEIFNGKNITTIHSWHGSDYKNNVLGSSKSINSSTGVIPVLRLEMNNKPDTRRMGNYLLYHFRNK